jgi:hypothetical protein
LGLFDVTQSGEPPVAISAYPANNMLSFQRMSQGANIQWRSAVAKEATALRSQYQSSRATPSYRPSFTAQPPPPPPAAFGGAYGGGLIGYGASPYEQQQQTAGASSAYPHASYGGGLLPGAYGAEASYQANQHGLAVNISEGDMERSTIHVGNLRRDFKKSDVEKLLKHMGIPKARGIAMKPPNKNSDRKLYALVEFDRPHQAQRAINTLDMLKWPEEGKGRSLRVKWARETSAPPPPSAPSPPGPPPVVNGSDELGSEWSGMLESAWPGTLESACAYR